jgi:hypothetical protein
LEALQPGLALAECARLRTRITALEAELDKSQALLRASCEAIRDELTGLEKHIYNTLYEQIPYVALPNKSPAYFRVTEASRVMKHFEQRITQLEGALNGLKPLIEAVVSGAFGRSHYDAAKQAQHLLSSREGERPREDALAPGSYREWCRDPTLCQDKGTCPKDPTCAD